MTFEHILMGGIVIFLGFLYALTIWMEKDNKRMEKELKH